VSGGVGRKFRFAAALALKVTVLLALVNEVQHLHVSHCGRASNQQAEVEMLITGTPLCRLSVTVKVELVEPRCRDHVRAMVTLHRHRHKRTSALDENKA